MCPPMLTSEMAVFYYDMALILIHYDNIVVVVLSVDDASSNFILNFGFNNFMTFIGVETAVSHFGLGTRGACAVLSQEECRDITFFGV